MTKKDEPIGSTHTISWTPEGSLVVRNLFEPLHDIVRIMFGPGYHDRPVSEKLKILRAIADVVEFGALRSGKRKR